MANVLAKLDVNLNVLYLTLQLLLDEKLSTMNLSETVAMFVELVWTECLGYLDNVLQVSVDKLSLNDVGLYHTSNM